MSRHIDADVLSKAVYQSKNNNRHSGTILRLSHDNEHRHFLAMIDAAPTVDVSPDTKWISVKERLPEVGEGYAVVVSGKPCRNVTLDNAIEMAAYDQDEGWILEMWPEWTNANITHWMPLPEPPKEEGENT